MFGRSKETPSTPVSQGWSDASLKRQKVLLDVTSLRQSVSGSYGHWALEIGAHSRNSPLTGLDIAVEVELVDSCDAPHWARDRWREIPDSIEGHCELTRLNSPIHPDCFNVTLFVEAKGVDALSRTLSLAGAPGYKAVLDIVIDVPGNDSPDLWRSGWQTQTLRVVSWRLTTEVGMARVG